MTKSTNETWLPVVLIAGALIGWMGVLAAGAYWAPVGESEGGDHRKLLVVAGTTGMFLLLWGGVLWRFTAKRRQHQQLQQADEAENFAGEDTENAENTGDR